MILPAMALLVVSCNKPDNSPNPGTDPRKVKYEITGSFSGKLTIIYNDNVSGNTVLNDVTLPWTKEITYGANVTGIGIGANGSTPGTPGQTATMKIYSGGTVVQPVSTGTVNASGGLSIPALAHVF